MGSVGPLRLLMFMVATAVIYGTRAQSYGDLRLAHGSSTSSSYTSGRLEIYINGQWGTVCDDSFGFTDGNVACRQLGFTGASRTPTTARYNSLFGQGSGHIWLDDVGCTGTESRLISCSNSGIGVHNCAHYEDVAIYCTSSGQSYGDLRLARGSLTSSSYSSGRLEIYINGQWGTVCDDYFATTDANVACRQLGYTAGASRSPVTASSNSLFGSGSGTIWLDDVGCTGSESCLVSCSNRGVGVEDCTHFEDVAIFCSGTHYSSTNCSSINRCSSSQWRCSNGQCISSYQRCDGHRQCSDGSDELDCSQRNGDLRLARGSTSSSNYSSGRLEIFINGQWGTVCDDSFGYTDARVACRQLGYSGASGSPVTASTNSWFGSGSGTIWLDDVGCTGSQTCLLSCSNRGIGSHNCAHSEDVAIFCSGTRSSSTDCSYINTCTSSQWRCSNGQCISSYQHCDGDQECSDGSDELNCSCSSSQWRCSNRRCISSSQRCDGNRECTDGSDELNCYSSCRGWACSNGQCISSYQRCNGYRECSDGSDELSCGTSQRNGDLRLARGSTSSSTYSSGRLEIFINGQWGTVCDDYFGYTDASVACRQLGYSGGSSRYTTASTNSLFGSGSGTIWLDDVGCTGSESCLVSCSNRGIGSHNCAHSEDVAIYCSGTRYSSTDCSFVRTCSSSQWRCDNGQCISSYQRCNGDQECTDGSDELNCTLRNGDLRLARGSQSLATYSSGRLEIYINGQWGTVCDDSFGFTDGNVACRQLGFTGASRSPTTASYNSLFGSGSGRIWLDDVGCSGSESCLLSCSNRGIGSHNCLHSEDVAIYCSGTRFSRQSSDCSSANSQTLQETFARKMLGITLGSVVGFVSMATIICFATLLICFIVPGCPMRKLYHQRYTRLSNETENNPASAFAETTFTEESGSPPLNTLNLTSATAAGIIPTGHTLVSSVDTDVHTVDPPTANSDSLAPVATPGDTLTTTPSEAVSTAPEPTGSDGDDTSLLDVSETTQLIQDAGTDPHPPQIHITVPSPDASNVPPPGSHLGEGGEPSLPTSLESDDTHVM